MTIRSLALLALLAACGDSSPLPPGAACTTDTECQSGLSCLDVAQINGSTCTVVGKSCTITCQGDNICTTQLGLGFQCFAGCGADKTCGEVANP
jgi:hypothetical protein